MRSARWIASWGEEVGWPRVSGACVAVERHSFGLDAAHPRGQGTLHLLLSEVRKGVGRERSAESHPPQTVIRAKYREYQTVVGLMPARHMVELIDALDLDANPRNSKLGPVTEADCSIYCSG